MSKEFFIEMRVISHITDTIPRYGGKRSMTGFFARHYYYCFSIPPIGRGRSKILGLHIFCPERMRFFQTEQFPDLFGTGEFYGRIVQEEVANRRMLQAAGWDFR